MFDGPASTPTGPTAASTPPSSKTTRSESSSSQARAATSWRSGTSAATPMCCSTHRSTGRRRASAEGVASMGNDGSLETF